MTDDRASEMLRGVELIFILAVALSVIALAPLALPLLRIAWSAVGSRAAGAAVVPDSARDVELSVRRRLYGNCRGPAPVRPGRLIQDRYHLLGRVGVGGMAIVYRAYDELLKREVAIKFIAERFAANPGFVERFRHEARLCANLAHANIVAILDAGLQPCDFIVMEFVDGLDARQLLQRRGRLTPGETVHVVAQIGDALTHAHHQGVVHGDVSPSNILVRRSDRVAKLADFGLASRATGLGSTHAAATLGTPGQVAPEVLWGGQPTPRSDLYCLGVVAYRCLAGPTELCAGDAGATALLPTAIPRMPRLGKVRPDLPPGLVAAVQQAVAFDPDSRQDSVAEFRAQLLGARGRLVPAQRARAKLPASARSELPRAA
jgi:serine/threonine protein kinase